MDNAANDFSTCNFQNMLLYSHAIQCARHMPVILSNTNENYIFIFNKYF